MIKIDRFGQLPVFSLKAEDAPTVRIKRVQTPPVLGPQTAFSSDETLQSWQNLLNGEPKPAHKKYELSVMFLQNLAK